MIRKEAISVIAEFAKHHPIISANGFVSRDLYDACDKPSNFYMIGSMGLASSIGLGVAMKYHDKKIFVFDGDGNIIMNLGSLTTIGIIKPKNFVHIVFDNNSHESTGGQPTNSSMIKLEELAKVENYKVFTANSIISLKKILKKTKKLNGPLFILVKIKKGGLISNRVNISPIAIRSRFMNSLH